MIRLLSTILILTGLTGNINGFPIFEIDSKGVVAKTVEKPIESRKLETTEDIKEYIRFSAKALDVDENLALDLAFWESGYNPKAQNPNSSAGGIYMFIDSTWKMFCQSKTYKPSKYEPKDNISCAMRLLRNKKTLRQHWGADPIIKRKLKQNGYW